VYRPPHDPSAAPPARIDRRGWLRATIGIIAGAISSIVGVVVGGAVLTPGLAARRDTWVPAGRLSELADGIPTPVTVRVARLDGYYEAVEQQVVFLIKSTSGDGVRALSTTCTHLGCRVSYDAVKKVIKCPCHGGTFTPDGKVIAGPPPRPLPELSARVEGARVFVQL
jgi:nitrite reductase/ring-hydroxylating ferredoxin subunit